MLQASLVHSCNLQISVSHLCRPLRDDEKIPVRQHRVVSILSSEDHNGEQADTPKKKRKKERHHKKKEEKKTDKKVSGMSHLQSLPTSIPP